MGGVLFIVSVVCVLEIDVVVVFYGILFFEFVDFIQVKVFV